MELHSPDLFGPGHPASFLPSKEYARPSHEQPVSPGECKGQYAVCGNVCVWKLGSFATVIKVQNLTVCIGVR